MNFKLNYRPLGLLALMGVAILSGAAKGDVLAALLEFSGALVIVFLGEKKEFRRLVTCVAVGMLMMFVAVVVIGKPS
jgi:hypothetical protein